MADVVLRAEQVTKSFKQAGARLDVLKDVNVILTRGEMVGLVAPSGAGKSTLLHILGLLDVPSTGSLQLTGQGVGADDAQRTNLRMAHIGFVYQFHHLLPEFSAVENVMMPLLVRGERRSHAREQAAELLTTLGLAERLSHRPARLSGGEQQRVAIARALITQPDLLLADEPTGNLDPATAHHVFDLMMNVLTKVDESKRPAMLLATHNVDMAKRMSRIIQLENGVLA